MKKWEPSKKQLLAPLLLTSIVATFFMAIAVVCQNQPAAATDMTITGKEVGQAYESIGFKAERSRAVVTLDIVYDGTNIVGILAIIFIIFLFLMFLGKVGDEIRDVHDDVNDSTEEEIEVGYGRSTPSEVHDYIVPKASSNTCPYCGRVLMRPDSSFCWNCGAAIAEPPELHAVIAGERKKAVRKIGKCMVCNLEVDSDDTALWCPYCGNVAHRTHMFEWLHVKDYCPVCKQHLEEKDLSEQPVKQRHRKRKT